jgi:hypothetical protein
MSNGSGNIPAGGGSRMKTEQTGATTTGTATTAPKAATAPARKGNGRAQTAVQAAVGIDYEKLAGMVAQKLQPVFAPRAKQAETDQFNVGQHDDLGLMLADGSLATGGADIAAIDKPLHSDYVQELAFMEELITITVAETEDANAENPIIVGNNGAFFPFFRGQPVTAKRKFVDNLIVKATRVTTPEVTNAAGERVNLIKRHSAHRYPFTVNEDRNPRGREWLVRRLAEIV